MKYKLLAPFGANFILYHPRGIFQINRYGCTCPVCLPYGELAYLKHANYDKSAYLRCVNYDK